MAARPEKIAWVAAAAVTALLLLARTLLLPDPPQRTPLPAADDLRRLSAYLEPTHAAVTTPQRVNVRGDPFRSPLLSGGGGGRQDGQPGTGSPAGPRWTVSAVLITDERSVAVVNDRLVRAGDAVEGGATVESVGRDHVILRAADGRLIRLDLQT